MNRVDMIGSVSSRIQYHCTRDGRDLLRFALEVGDLTHYCIAWGELATSLHQYMNAADQLMIRGELTYRKHRVTGGGDVNIPEIEIRGYSYL